MTDKIYVYGTKESVNARIEKHKQIDARFYYNPNRFHWLNSQQWPDGATIHLYTKIGVDGLPNPNESYLWDASRNQLK